MSVQAKADGRGCSWKGFLHGPEKDFPPPTSSISFLLIPRRRNAPPQFGRRGSGRRSRNLFIFLQTFLSADYSLKPIIFLFKTSCLRHTMSLSHGFLIAEMLLIWMREKITTQSFKSRSRKHFMPRPIFSAPRHFAQKYFDHSEGGGGRVKINRR